MINIHYITYQTFPAETGNSLQSICNIIEMVRMKNEVTLTFPNRDSASSSSLSELQSYYNFSERIEINRTKHPLPFGKINYFQKINFHISHFLWSLGVISFSDDLDSADLFITRSDWVFYFLSKRKKRVVFECHGESKLRKLLLKKSLKNKNSRVVFLTKSLESHYDDTGFKPSQAIVLGSAFREDLFFKNFKKIDNQVVFVGNLLRFGKSRDIEFILDCFADNRLENYQLKIVGGPSEYVTKLQEKINILGMSNIELLGRLNQKETAEVLLRSEIGILTNSSDNINSRMHTSPLKYFEYLASNLKVVAVKFHSHQILPFGENIEFFKANNKESFISAILKLQTTKTINLSSYKTYSYKNRVEQILDFARLEGLEPPTL